MMTRYWLMKSEPESYSIDDLKRDGKTYWSGVRNYQARNMMRDDMAVGDRVLFYHSGGDLPGVAGIAEICRKGYPDFTAWNPKDDHYDPKASEKNPIWMMVDLKFVKKFKALVTLAAIRAEPKLKAMPLLQRGQRLSIQPVEKAQFETILKMAQN